ncbi:forkhead box protein I1-A-like [Oppia nitens]|uniref:forkhead box protein I1-A-like n=1 Tax=Oppia nitens TaxID=1686743 RepID=UPI0023DCB431|nr:forkhead box protein I1-A-like [Oppia nitens]
MCESNSNGSAQAMIALRMKTSTVNPFLDNPLPNEATTAPHITSSSVNNINAVSNAFSLANFAGHRLGLPTPNGSPNFNLADYQRLQFYDYTSQASVRLRLGPSAPFANTAYNMPPGYGHPAFADGTPFGAMTPFARFDPRFRFMHEEPKPQHSYIGLIAIAILSMSDQKMVLSDIYQHILDNYPYFRNRGPGWRNSIRHNLSLNDCFVKSGRSANGKGHYWAIHPANLDDFKKGDFRRRKAQRKVRKHMGLSVPDDDDSPSPTPPPMPPTGLVNPFGHHSAALMASSGFRLHANQAICANDINIFNDLRFSLPNKLSANPDLKAIEDCRTHEDSLLPSVSHTNIKAIKRQFDVESLLAPDCDSTVDDNINRIVSENKSSSNNSVECIEQLDDNNRRSTTPPSMGSQNDFIINKTIDSYDSNSSSPSISSTAERHHSPPMIHPRQPIIPTLSPGSWRAAQLQSLQNLHQMNAGLINQSLQSVGPGAAFPVNLPWAMSAAALSNAQMAATILGYASVANQAFDLTSDANKR